MRFRLFLTGLTLIYAINSFGQDPLKKMNPVIFFESSFSMPLTQLGVQANLDLNYQVKANLYTLRFVGAAYFDVGTVALTPFNYFPKISNKGGLEEYGALYGRRIIKAGHSFNFSAGLSFNDRTGFKAGPDNQPQPYESYYIGLPFEATWSTFKAKKGRYYPFRKSTAYGDSFGFKISGNVSQHSYVALGVVWGMGYHKQY